MKEKMTTKIVITRMKVDDNVISQYSREDNGMIIGAVYGGETTFGEDRNKAETRHFIDEGHATTYLKSLCREYLDRDDIDFLVRDGETLVRPSAQMPQRRIV